MDRLKRSDKGFTLLELVIAIALSAVVLLSASNLLINFGKFSANTVKAEASLMGTSLGAFEEITKKIISANAVAINPDTALIAYPGTCAAGSCVEIRVDENLPGTLSNSADDTIYTYWQSGAQLLRSVNGAPAAGTAIAGDINSLSFSQPVGGPKNSVTVILEARAASGPKGETSKEHLETVVSMRLRSAN
jgi:prepilin-type N-terminal cleavage/methylation domain-containing protein